MAYQIQDYSAILGMQGISDTTVQSHFKLYQGYVNNTNALLEKINQLPDEGKDRTPEFAEIQRRFAFEFNGMRLHEYYFENLKGNGSLDTNSLIQQQIVQDFGSFERWQKEFTSIGMMRGIGWAILFYDTSANRLINNWITLHEVNILAGLQPLLVMDVWEHAYYLDYQTERAGYVNAFLKNLKWQEVSRRLESNCGVQRKKAA